MPTPPNVNPDSYAQMVAVIKEGFPDQDNLHCALDSGNAWVAYQILNVIATKTFTPAEVWEITQRQDAEKYASTLTATTQLAKSFADSLGKLCWPIRTPLELEDVAA